MPSLDSPPAARPTLHVVTPSRTRSNLFRVDWAGLSLPKSFPAAPPEQGEQVTRDQLECHGPGTVKRLLELKAISPWIEVPEPDPADLEDDPAA